tara:strand:- start:28 stop:357 length:330 start_codon:yes stop_codon:yes gene_type:complete
MNTVSYSLEISISKSIIEGIENRGRHLKSMIDTIILTGSCPRCGTGTLTNDEDMFGVRIFCVMCGHNKDLGKINIKVRNIRDLVIAVLDRDQKMIAEGHESNYPPSIYG